MTRNRGIDFILNHLWSKNVPKYDLVFIHQTDGDLNSLIFG